MKKAIGCFKYHHEMELSDKDAGLFSHAFSLPLGLPLRVLVQSKVGSLKILARLSRKPGLNYAESSRRSREQDLFVGKRRRTGECPNINL